MDLVKEIFLRKIGDYVGKDKTVKLYHVGYWYYIYGNDAKIVAFLTGYKLYDNKCGIPSVGFPEYSLDKVLR